MFSLLGCLAQFEQGHQYRHPMVYLKVWKAWYRLHSLPQLLIRPLPGREIDLPCNCGSHLSCSLLRHNLVAGGFKSGFY